ncbi:hypothetical protein CSB11_00910 [Candidatus Campbellbacteria bacterium]|nr:MAG: hypothetical protein CSB11_00910 [Candidatus Campbellbacteria bacterium]
MKKIIVKKKGGEKERFNETKLRNSLRNSGVSKKIEDEILASIKNNIKKDKDGVVESTKIYKISKDVLKEKADKKIFLRYNLTSAISKLGPEGFAFEKFISLVFKSYGYGPVYVGKKINGKCVVHEMDIVAQRGKDLVTAELKFHNSRTKKTDLKVALYMKSRFDDILNSNYYKNNNPIQLIITNTKFTDNAKKYSNCAGVGVLSWNYPEKDNLHDFILKSKIHPITALETISQKAKQYFLLRKIVSIEELQKNNFKFLNQNPYIIKSKIQTVKDEIKDVIECLGC